MLSQKRMLSSDLNWGIIGAGQIVSRWIRGARQAGISVDAIASRTRARAEEAAVAYGIGRVLTCEELVADPAVSVVYIATPHPSHKEWAIKALQQGKHVLVEKPAAVSAADFREMAETSRINGCFLMEAMWTFFFPAWEFSLRQVKKGAIGRLLRVDVSFGFESFVDPSSRLFNRALAGGSLLDVGVYNLHAARKVVAATPLKLAVSAQIGETGVDESAELTLSYPNGVQAFLSSSIRQQLPNEAVIYGTKGSLTLPVFWSPSRVILRQSDCSEKVLDFPIPQPQDGPEDEGFQYEILHVQQCIIAGRTESPVMPHRLTEQVLRLCDQIRLRWDGVGFSSVPPDDARVSSLLVEEVIDLTKNADNV